MTNPFEKDYDDILNEVLTDYANLDDAPDTSVGSMAYVMAAVLSTMLWGLYKYQDYINLQHFLDTADSENLDRWGAIYGIDRLTDETDADYLARLLAFIRQPPAGGNEQDFEDWALDQDHCYYEDSGTTYYNAFATVVSWDDGPGTVNVYTIIDDEDECGTAIEEGLRAATETYINTVRPAAMYPVNVYAASPTTQTVDITIPVDSNVNTEDLTEAIVEYINGLGPGQTLYKSKIVSLAIDCGAEYCVCNTPSSENNTIDNDEFYRTTTGDVTINEV